MPDSSGWPTLSEVVTKAQAIPGVTLSSAQTTNIASTLSAVIAHFQSPKGARGDGGTGRTFTPVTETRYFNGNGFGELYIGDVVPGQTPVVTDHGVTVPQAFMKESRKGLGFNILALPATVASAAYGFTWPSVFSQGEANIAVTTLWGVAASVPSDVYYAVLGEVTALTLIEGFGGLTGMAKSVKTLETATDFDSDYSALTLWSDRYKRTVELWRETQSWKLRTLTPRMS